MSLSLSPTPASDEAWAHWIATGCAQRLKQSCEQLEHGRNIAEHRLVEAERRLRDAERHLYAIRESQHRFQTEVMSGALRAAAFAPPPILIIQNPDQK